MQGTALQDAVPPETVFVFDYQNYDRGVKSVVIFIYLFISHSMGYSVANSFQFTFEAALIGRVGL